MIWLILWSVTLLLLVATAIAKALVARAIERIGEEDHG
jgi:hypothetical protein